MNPGGGGFSELKLCHSTSAWVTEQGKERKREKERERKRKKEREREREKGRPGAVAHAHNPSTLEGEAGGSQCQEFETSLANMVKPQLY